MAIYAHIQPYMGSLKTRTQTKVDFLSTFFRKKVIPVSARIYSNMAVYRV